MARTSNSFELRVRKLQGAMKKNSLDAFVVLNRPNTRYLSGFGGTASTILVTRDEVYFFTDMRYLEQAKKLAAFSSNGRNVRKGGNAEVEKILKRVKARSVGFEGQISFNQFKGLEGTFKNCELKESSELVTELRMVKSADELKSMRAAAKITDAVFAAIVEDLEPGMSELAIERRLYQLGSDLGAEGPSFPAIVAAGKNSSNPHYSATDYVIKRGDLLTIDMGFLIDGYCSDMTRTVVVGKATEKQKRIYKIVLQAEAGSARMTVAGKTGRQIDAAARRPMIRGGVEKYFPHGLGHGVGLEVHENPFMGKKCEVKMRPGFVMTVEPGLYIAGWGGIRIEDMVLVTREGNEILTRSPKGLIEVGL